MGRTRLMEQERSRRNGKPTTSPKPTSKHGRADRLLSLQGSIGNQAVLRAGKSKSERLYLDDDFVGDLDWYDFDSDEDYEDFDAEQAEIDEYIARAFPPRRRVPIVPGVVTDRLGEFKGARDDTRRNRDETYAEVGEEKRRKAEEQRQQEEAAAEEKRLREEAERLRLQEEAEQRAREEEQQRLLAEESLRVLRLYQVLRERLAEDYGDDWADLRPGQQERYVEQAFTHANPSQEELESAKKPPPQRRRGGKGSRKKQRNAPQVQVSPEERLAEYVAGRVDAAVESVGAAIHESAARNRIRRRAEGLADDKLQLKGYIAGLSTDPQVVEILNTAVDKLSFSNDAWEAKIKQPYDESILNLACSFWHKMDRRVGGLEYVSNMHVPGRKAPMGWKQRGEYLERTRNLMCKVDNSTNNVHLITFGGWREKI